MQRLRAQHQMKPLRMLWRCSHYENSATIVYSVRLRWYRVSWKRYTKKTVNTPRETRSEADAKALEEFPRALCLVASVESAAEPPADALLGAPPLLLLVAPQLPALPLAGMLLLVRQHGGKTPAEAGEWRLGRWTAGMHLCDCATPAPEGKRLSPPFSQRTCR